MQSHYAAEFERELSCTQAELRRWIPGASADCPLRFESAGARVEVEAGELALDWHVLPPRRIGPVQLPRLLLRFRFVAVSEAGRQRFMRHFDLYMQRGGG